MGLCMCTIYALSRFAFSLPTHLEVYDVARDDDIRQRLTTLLDRLLQTHTEKDQIKGRRKETRPISIHREKRKRETRLPWTYTERI